jgi:hypothetical protein
MENFRDASYILKSKVSFLSHATSKFFNIVAWDKNETFDFKIYDASLKFSITVKM